MVSQVQCIQYVKQFSRRGRHILACIKLLTDTCSVTTSGTAVMTAVIAAYCACWWDKQHKNSFWIFLLCVWPTLVRFHCKTKIIRVLICWKASSGGGGGVPFLHGPTEHLFQDLLRVQRSNLFSSWVLRVSSFVKKKSLHKRAVLSALRN
jgi:hypothetical protein